MKRASELLAAALTVALAVWLQVGEEFEFFFREQTQLFSNSAGDIASGLMQVGGFSLMLSQFLVQFFCLPWAGALVSAALSGLAARSLWKILDGDGSRLWLLPLCFLPLVAECISLSDQFYWYQGFVSFCLVVFAIQLMPVKTGLRSVIIDVVFSAALFFLVGPAAILFVICLMVRMFAAPFGLEQRSLLRAAVSILPLLTVVLLGFLSFRLGWTPNLTRTFFAAGYFDELVVPRFFINLSWILLPSLILLAFIVKKRGKLWLPVPSALLVAVFAWAGHGAMYDRLQYHLLEEFHDAATGNWQGILDNPCGKDRNFVFINLRNLAKSHLGLLPDALFDSPQNGVRSIVSASTGNNQNPDVCSVLAWVYLRMGNAAAAQNAAFDAGVGYKWGNPYMIRILVRTNLAYGNEAVAEKYICALEKTFFHRKWAREQRSLLENTEALAADPEIARLRKCIGSGDHLTSGPAADLEYILANNPEDAAARAYYESTLLVERRVEDIAAYFLTCPKPAPRLLEEAYVVQCRMAGKNPDESLLSPGTLARYDSFISRMNAASSGGRSPVDALHKDYKDSFWYYLISVRQ